MSSTWSTGSLLGSRPELLRELLADLPVDSYRVVMVAHPNIWHGHGPWQLRTWLADCVRAGLVIVPELEGWRAALIAADCVIGDHGAVTCYGAALGRPVLLGAFPEPDVAAGSPVDVLGRLAPRLVPERSPRDQIDSVVAGYQPRQYASVENLVSSVPDESPRLLRELFYRLMGLPEPPTEPMLHRIGFDGLPSTPPVPRVSAAVVSAHVDPEGGVIQLTRYPAEVQRSGAAPPDAVAGHLAAHVAHPGRRLRANADVLFVLADGLTGEADAWLTSTLRDHPGCAIAAIVGELRCVTRDRTGHRLELAALASGIDSCLLASAAFAWQAAGHTMGELARGVRLAAGGHETDVTVRVW